MKRVLALLVALMMLMPGAFALAEGEASDVRTFTWFIADMYAKIPPDDAPVMKQIEELYGVKFERIVPSAEPLERLNIMLATNDMPDLITFPMDYADSLVSIMHQFIDSGKVLPLNEYLETYCPDVVNVNMRHVYEKLKDENDIVWYLPEAYSIGEVDELYAEDNRSLNLRNEYFEEVGYDAWPATLDEYKALLPIIKEKYPGMSPMSLALGAQGMLKDIINVAVGAYGLNGNEEIIYTDGKISHITESPEIKAFFKFLNDANIDGYLDIESPVLSLEMLKQKAVAGQVWSYFGEGWAINSEVIAYEQSLGTIGRMMYDHIKANDSIEKLTYSRKPDNLYLTGTVVTAACENPEDFFKFYAKSNTEEGRFNVLGTVNWDFRGENTVENTEDYIFVIQPEMTFEAGLPASSFTAWCGEMWDSDENWYWNYGVEMMYPFTYGGGNMPGGKIDLVGGDNDVGIWWDEETTRTNNLTGWFGDQYWQRHRDMWVDTSPYTSLYMDTNSDEYAAKIAVGKAVEKYLPRAIMAASDEEFETVWQQMIDECKAEGMDSFIAKCQALSAERLASWES